MLVRLSIGNILSFRDEVELSLVASSEKSHAHHKRTVGSGKSHDLLRLALLYGPNAAGKSNFVHAIGLFQTLFRHGTDPDEPTGLSPFKLDDASQKLPSRFECTFVVRDTMFTYGIVADGESVHEEWLFAEQLQRGKRERMVFERLREAEESRVTLGRLLVDETKQGRQFLMHVAEGTRSNQPFLTELVLRNVAFVDAAWRWLTESLILIGPSSSYGPLIHRAVGDDHFVSFLSDSLRSMNTGISRLDVETNVVSESVLPAGMSSDEFRKVMDALGEGESIIRHGMDGSRTLFRKTEDDKLAVETIKSVHKGSAGEDVKFDFSEESDGTRRMIDLLPVLLEQHSGGRVFVIDELDRSLHTHLVRWFIKQFLTEGASDAQIVATVHDTNILDQSLIRRDETWLIEKDKHESSDLYSLADFNIRNDLALEGAYLNGRFGALPFSTNLPLFVNEPPPK